MTGGRRKRGEEGRKMKDRVKRRYSAPVEGTLPLSSIVGN